MSTTVAEDTPQTEPAAPQSTSGKKKGSSREYVVLEERGNQGWTEIKRVTASGTESAIRSLEKELKPNTRYVAIPSRSFRPGTPSVKTVTTIQLAFD